MKESKQKIKNFASEREWNKDEKREDERDKRGVKEGKKN